MNDKDRRDLLFTLSPLAYVRSLGLKPYPWQIAYLQSDHRFKILKGARRSGKSFIISAKPCHRAKYFPGSISLVLAYRLDQAEEDIRYIRKFMAMDPGYPKCVRDNNGEIELSNGSRIIAVPATEEAARGYPDADIIIGDEAAFILNLIFADCLYPMLNGNDNLEFNFISTTHGKSGDPGRFFYEAFNDPSNDRYEIRAPWDIDPDDNNNLIPAMAEAEYQRRMKKQGIKAFYSPRHANLETQMKILERGVRYYRQNNLVEFVEPDDQVFSYEDIAAAAAREVKGLDMGIRESQALIIP